MNLQKGVYKSTTLFTTFFYNSYKVYYPQMAE